MHRWGAFRYFAVTPTHITPGAIGITKTRTLRQQRFDSSVNGVRHDVPFRVGQVINADSSDIEEISANGKRLRCVCFNFLAKKGSNAGFDSR
jgi:hypothetical protein